MLCSWPSKTPARKVAVDRFVSTTWMERSHAHADEGMKEKLIREVQCHKSTATTLSAVAEYARKKVKWQTTRSVGEEELEKLWNKWDGRKMRPVVGSSPDRAILSRYHSHQAWEWIIIHHPLHSGKENADAAAAVAVAVEVPWIDYIYYATMKECTRKTVLSTVWAQSLIIPYSKFVALMIFEWNGSLIQFGSVEDNMRSYRLVLLSSFSFPPENTHRSCVTPSWKLVMLPNAVWSMTRRRRRRMRRRRRISEQEIMETCCR